MRVLVVDDDETIRAVMIEALADEGHDVAQAANGAEALALLRACAAEADGHPDLILLDLLMPGMDGWAFVDTYRQASLPHAPLVLLTAASVERAGTVAGRPLPPAAATLAKPFMLDDLLALVRRYSPPG